MSTDLQKHRQIIEEAVMSLGRDDVGVGVIAEGPGGMLSVTFSRGTRTYVADIPIAELQDREQAEQAVRKALLGLTKLVAMEAIANHGQG